MKDENVIELTNALKQIKWDILGMSEVRRMGERITSHPDYLLYQLGETQGHHGVGFIIKKHITKYIEEFIGISERIAIMNVKLPGYKDPWSIVQVYSPTEQSSLETINTFYQDLNEAIQEYTHKNLIVIGDYKGQIGARRPGENTILGPFSYSNKTRCRNGEKITNFALENNLSILNTMYKKNRKNMWTWISPDGKVKNEIDFIMTNRSSYFTNFTVIKRFNFNTNHRLIRAELKTKQPTKPRPRQNVGITKLSKQQLEQITIARRDEFIDFNKNTTNLAIQEKYNYIENTIKTQTKLLTNTKNETKNMLSTNTIKLLQDRNHLLSAKTTQNRRKEIAKISKEIKESIRKDRKQWRMETIENYILKTGGTKKALKELTITKDWIVKMKDERGKWNRHRTEILKTATSYYKKLYGNDTTQSKIKLVDPSNIPNILYSEVKQAIDTQKEEKAPGPDGIKNEILRHSKGSLIPVLADMFNDILNTETIPQQWTESIIILLYKKGDKYDIGNYRPISLMSNVYKIFAKVILKRIEITLDEHQPIEQAGFRKDYSVIDHIHVVRQVLEKYNEYQLTYYIAFIDYSKAFDSLLHEKIWEALLEQGIEHKYIRIIKNIYSRSTGRIQLETKSTPFRIEKGVRQGDPLSPKLFSAVLESIFRRLNWERLGINMDGVLLSHLRFADDIVLFAKTPEDLNKMLGDLATESAKVGLRLNPEKTRLMTNGSKYTIKLGNTEIDYADEYIYLGQLITQKEPMRKEVERRITNGWKRYWSLREAMKDKKLHINLKSKLFNTCILPVLTYGCQSWVLNHDILNKLATCQYAMERSMLNITKSDRLKNFVIETKQILQM